MLDEAITLGLRLDVSLSRQLVRFAASTHRSKSDVARDALRIYLSRRAPDDDLVREMEAIAAATSATDLALLDVLHDDVMGDEPDYDWGNRPS